MPNFASVDKLRKQEIILCILLWAIVFLIVPVFFFLNAHGGRGLTFNDVLGLWTKFLPYLALFLVHDLLLTPLLKKKKTGVYAALTVLLLVVFNIYIWNTRPAPHGPFHGPEPDMPWEMEPPGDRPENPPLPLGPEFMKFLLSLAIIGVNLGVKANFESRRKEQRLSELQTENLQMQLEGLRSQINPHFLMNTLNNIRALVYIDQEKAAESIDEFSKMMRTVLYDGNAPTIALEKELEFIRHFISLMRLRYPEEGVGIETHFPETGTDGAEVPPLLLATFIENAFKHGISYEKRSFVRVSVSLEGGRILFRCENSRTPDAARGSSGIGLGNVRKRLSLLYGSDFILDSDSMDDFYGVLLSIPLKPKQE